MAYNRFDVFKRPISQCENNSKLNQRENRTRTQKCSQEIKAV